MIDSLRRVRNGPYLMVTAVVSLVGVMATTPRLGKRDLASKGGSPQLVLHASSVRRAVSTADSIEIEYSVRNDGPPTTFTNLPEAFRFDVVDPAGRALTPRQLADYEPPVLGSAVDVRLPRGGFIGQRIRFACIVNGYYERVPSPGWCGWRYEFTTSGEYRIVVRYREPREGGLVMTSDTARIVYRPKP